MNPYRPRTIDDLPSEILIRIFQYVYHATEDLELDSSQDLTDPSIFPGCIKKVSRKWRKLIRSIPHFSTRVIIFVDEPVSVDRLLDQFSLSKTLLIEVFIVRKDYDAVADELERGRIKEIMQALVLHVTRCQVVVFDVLHDYSLPRITYFSGKANQLCTLRMKSRLHGTPASHVIQPSPSLSPNPKAFLCPRLQYLDLDGRIFIMAMSIQGWAQSIRMLSQKRLTISNLSPRSDFDLDNLLEALAQLGHLTELKLSNTELDVPSNVGRPFISIFIQNFEFEGLKRNFLGGFFSHHFNKIDVSHIALNNCELGLTDHFTSWHLTLRNLPKEENITEFIKSWDGFALHIESCAGLDDTLILALSDFRPSQDRFYANTLRQLEIVSSGPVSVKAIKGLVFVRALEAANHDPDEIGGICKPLYSISVIHTDVAISHEDKKWLNSQLDSAFYWYTTPLPVCESPLVECDLADWDFSAVDENVLQNLGLSVRRSLPASSQSVTTPSSPLLSGDYSSMEWSIEDLKMIDHL